MKTSQRTWWLLFAVCSVVALGALIGVTVMFLEVESTGLRAHEKIRHQQQVRLALWLMDSWLTPHLATEAARSPLDYQTDLPGRDLNEVMNNNPLVKLRSEFIQLHFQVVVPSGRAQQQDRVQSVQVSGVEVQLPVEGCAVSPQVLQQGQQAEVLLRHGWTAGELDLNDQTLARISRAVSIQDVLAVENSISPEMMNDPSPGLAENGPAPEVKLQQRKQGKNFESYSRRSKISNVARNAQAQQWASQQRMQNVATRTEEKPPVMIGPLVPLWIQTGSPTGVDGCELFCLRRVRIEDTALLQGFVIHWSRLERALLREVEETLPGATLRPVIHNDVIAAAEEGNVLASVPVELVAPPPPIGSHDGMTSSRVMLLVMWGAALLALTASALTLRATIAFGEKRSRFASAVTHELRTPLTTFRMYSEMLADGMVKDPAQRQLYLETLKNESTRLAALVENVLAYARVEDGRGPSRRAEISLGDLCDRVRPQLARRAEEGRMCLEIEHRADRDLKLFVDPEAVAQILFNLVDNACKYGRDDHDPRVTLTVTRRGSKLTMRVRDHGPGVPRGKSAAIFAPFDRCGRESSATPGVGLGLALSHELARAMGGQLRIDASVQDGACFVLELPIFS